MHAGLGAILAICESQGELAGFFASGGGGKFFLCILAEVFQTSADRAQISDNTRSMKQKKLFSV